MFDRNRVLVEIVCPLRGLLMSYIGKICSLATFVLGFCSSLSALEEADRSAIQAVIKDYTHAWNQNGGKGFSDGFTEDANFVNVFGMHFR